MKILAFIILVFSVIISTYFQKKSSSFLKEDFKRGFLRKLEIYPTSFTNEEYSKKAGILYRNIGLLVLMLGVIVFIILVSLSS